MFDPSAQFGEDGCERARLPLESFVDVGRNKALRLHRSRLLVPQCSDNVSNRDNYTKPIVLCQRIALGDKAGPMKRFGEKLHTLRTGRHLTLQQTAAALGYATHAYISEIETGKKVPTVTFVLKVAEFFHVSTDALLKDDLEIPVRASRK
jgi:DNA-binding XRE family transcriptional regulator